jgi:hypothetical protein
LFCTGRPNRAILDAWGRSPRRILRCNEDDLDVFIRERVASLAEGYNRGMKDMMVEKLRQRAERTFLWLDVVIRDMRRISFPTIQQVEEVIENLPSELDKLYEQLVTEAVKRDSYIARLLACVVYARQALDLRALGHAVAIDPQESCDSYEQYCKRVPDLTEQLVRQNVGTLLDVVENKVYFIHQSVRDYFKHHPNPFLDCFGKFEPRLTLAHVCMRYLAMEEIGCSLGSDEILFQKYPLLPYAAMYWYSHIDKAEDVQCSLIKYLEEILLALDTRMAQLWMGIVSKSRLLDTETPSRLSEVAIRFDIGWLAELLLSGAFEKLKDIFPVDSLRQAVDHRSAIVLRVLLEHKVGKALRLTEDDVARIAGLYDKEMFELLLCERDNDVIITTETVKAAAGNSRNGKEVMTLLLDRRGNDVHITEDVVKVAAGNWRSGKEIMRLLLIT